MSKYLTSRDRYNYLADKISFNLSCFLDKGHQGKMDALGFNNRGKLVRNLADGSRMEISNRADGFHILVNPILNMNRLLRYHFMEEFELRARDLKSDSHDDNVIPSKLLHILQDEGYSITDLRGSGYELLWNEIRRVKKLIRSWFKKYLGVKFRKSSINCAIQTCEISYDIKTPLGVEIAKDISIKKNMNNVASDSSTCKHNNGTRVVPLSSEAKTSDVEPYMLYGHFTLDGSYYKFYLKESGSKISLNRFERTFYSKQLTAHLGTRSIAGKDDLKHKIQSLGKITFEEIFPIFNQECYVNDEQKVQIAKNLIRVHYKHHWELASNCLLEGSCSIHTGKNGGSPKALIRPTLDIFKKPGNNLLKKKAPAVYVLNWVWILARN